MRDNGEGEGGGDGVEVDGVDGVDEGAERDWCGGADDAEVHEGAMDVKYERCDGN